mmetsp:Transcript_18235/g.61957  ORF Transcript_18235/g.61957 Transcript_18235/m.61957 type:complete len:360 (+) Transcript_18235:201-1280(+)
MYSNARDRCVRGVRFHVVVMLPGMRRGYSNTFRQLQQFSHTLNCSVSYLGNGPVGEDYDRYPFKCRKGIGWGRFPHHADANEEKHIESFVKKEVVPFVEQMTVQGENVILLCAEKAGHLALPYLWELGYNFPVISIGGLFCSDIRNAPLVDATIFIVISGQDTPSTVSPSTAIRWTCIHSQTTKTCNIYLMPEETCPPRLHNGLLLQMINECIQCQDQVSQVAHYTKYGGASSLRSCWLPIQRSSAQICILEAKQNTCLAALRKFTYVFVKHMRRFVQKLISQQLRKELISLWIESASLIKGTTCTYEVINITELGKEDFVCFTGREPAGQHEFITFVRVHKILKIGKKSRGPSPQKRA